MPVSTDAQQVSRGGSDQSCATCHADVTESFVQSGKSQSFSRPMPGRFIEDFSSSFYHEPSERYYRFVQRGDDLVFQRHQVDTSGERINEIELVVDWVIGSGDRGRTYLHQTPNGELFELPVSWYDAGWRMSPGYDRRHHEGVVKRISQSCLSCHNAYPETPKSLGLYSPVHAYSHELPQGIDCQRCHGPGADHVAKAEVPGASRTSILESIVNPSKLPAERRHQICMSCHMQPSSTVSKIRRFDKPAFSFTPGDAYEDHSLWLDADEAGRAASERFEKNSHAYRLLQSRCFIASRGSLSCLRCHDPHRAVGPEERVSHYAKVCLECHSDPAKTVLHEESVRTWKREQARYESVDDNDCAACHMPKRRAQDFVHVSVTDHKVRRTPLSEDPLVPLEESTRVINDIRLLFSEHEPENEPWSLYRAVATLRAAEGAHEPALDYLEQFFSQQARPELEPYLDMLNGQMKLSQIEKARTTVTEILRRDPAQPQALMSLGLIESAAGNRVEALSAFERLVREEPTWADGWIGLGRELRSLNRLEEAAVAIRKAVALNPINSLTFFELGRISLAQENWSESAEALRKTLAIDPGFAPAYDLISEAYKSLNQRAQSLRYLRHGVRHARQPDALRAKLAALEN